MAHHLAAPYPMAILIAKQQEYIGNSDNNTTLFLYFTRSSAFNGYAFNRIGAHELENGTMQCRENIACEINSEYTFSYVD